MLMYAGSIARTNIFALPLGTAKLAMIDALDMGEVAARIGVALECPVAYLAQSPEVFREVLGLLIKSAWQLDTVCELFAEIAAGSLEEQISTTADFLSRPVVDLETLTKQFVGAFAPANQLIVVCNVDGASLGWRSRHVTAVVHRSPRQTDFTK